MKLLIPVNTIGIPCSLQASIDSWSRTDPPGCIIAVIPTVAALSTQSLNGKNADISFKSQIVPKDKELEIRKLLAEELVRGSIEFSLNLELKNPAANKQVNAKAALTILQQIKDIQKKTSRENVNRKVYFPIQDGYVSGNVDSGLDVLIDSLSDSLSDSFLMASIVRMPDVLETKQLELSDSDWEKINKAISQAIKKLNAYRMAEGTALLRDVLSRVANIMSSLEEVQKLDVKRVPAIKERLLMSSLMPSLTAFFRPSMASRRALRMLTRAFSRLFFWVRKSV